MQIELTEEEVAAIERWVVRQCGLTAVGHWGVPCALLSKDAVEAIKGWALGPALTTPLRSNRAPCTLQPLHADPRASAGWSSWASPARPA